MAAPERITLHTTWRHLVASSFGAVLVAAGGLAAVAAVGFTVPATVLLVLGCGLLAVVLFDVPVASVFDAHGVERHTLLRRHRLHWQPGDVLTRARPSLVRGEERLRQGGLVLRRGRRRYLLVDKAESPDEFGRLLRVVDVAGAPGAEVHVSAPSPPEGAPPTWLYRRRVWRPDDAPGR